jgi:cobalt-zinc-cadmium efflux system outer membrane protein
MTSEWKGIATGVLVLVLCASGTEAQTSTIIVDAERGMTVDELVELALGQSPGILAARAAVDAERGHLEQARAWANPLVTVSWQEQQKGQDHQLTAGFEWPLARFRRQGRIAIAQREADVTSLAVQDHERLRASEIREQAGRVLAAARTAAITEELLTLNRRSRDLLQARVRDGASPELELNQLDVEVRRLEAQRVVQVGEAEAALVELKGLVGAAPDADLVLRDDLEQTVRAQAPGDTPGPGTSAGLREAVAGRVDVRAAAARVGLAEAKIDQARREGRYDVSAFGSYSRMSLSFPLRGLTPDGRTAAISDVFHYLTVGVTITPPLANKNLGAIAAAEADRRGAEQQAKARELSARTELMAAQARDRAARQAVELYRSGARDLARRNLDVLRESYELGRNPLFDVFAEQRRYLDVESAYTDALTLAYQARIILLRALGEGQ